MTDEEAFACIAAQLCEDRAWLRQIRWITFRSRVGSICVRALCASAPAAGTWLLA